MDIRNFFGPVKTNDSKKEKVEEKSPHNVSKSSKKRRIIDSDSDEDEKKPTKWSNVQPEKEISQKNAKSALSRQSSGKTNLKSSTASSFFGSTPVERISKKTPKKTKSTLEDNHKDKDFLETLIQLEENKQKLKLESNHEDDNFEATLAALDSEEINKTETQEVRQESKNKTSKKRKSPRKSKKPKLFEMEVTPPPPKEKTVPKKVIVDKTPPVVTKKKNAGNYMAFMHREGPRSLGSKEMPQGEVDCLERLTFLLTGVLESFERDEAKAMIEDHGGKVMTTLSKNTNYIVIGRDSGASKLEKAGKLGTIQLTEDGLLELIQNRPGKGPRPVLTEGQLSQNGELSPKGQLSQKGEMSPKKKLKTEVSPKMKETKEKSTHNQIIEDVELGSETDERKPIVQSQMWVDKYKPSTLKQLIGQQGDKSNANKLLKWLKNWNFGAKTKKPVSTGRWNTNDDGSSYKAALLSGPPGIGKTTTAQLVCKEVGYDYIELNASDTRSKKSLDQAVSKLLLNQSLAGCFGGMSMGNVTKRHLIIMDEVDGMAGNEDRGGIQELIGLIKMSKIPLICICNDRNHIKMRSLSNYCFDLRFQKPRVEQIKAAMMTVAFKEKVKVMPNVLHDIVVASNQDIRLVLHNLSLWTSKEKSLTQEQAKKDIEFGTKHVKMGPFDVLREVFTIGMNPKATINDKAQLFFHDYSIAPLFVQENYVHVQPANTKANVIDHLERMSNVADSLCIGDLIEKQIRSQNSWSLLPVQAIFSSVVPGTVLAGNLQQLISFPAWLGKNSNRNKMDRILQELQMHMRTRISGNKTEVALEYLPLLKRALTLPLIEKELDGIQDSLSVMEKYFLLREDFDSVVELSLWTGQNDPRTKISTKVKSAFTRTYNKRCCQNPYASSNVVKKRKLTNNSELLGEDEPSDDDEEEDENVEHDAMIKVKKTSAKDTKVNEPSTSKKSAKPTSSRGRKKK